MLHSLSSLKSAVKNDLYVCSYSIFFKFETEAVAVCIEILFLLAESRSTLRILRLSILRCLWDIIWLRKEIHWNVVTSIAFVTFIILFYKNSLHEVSNRFRGCGTVIFTHLFTNWFLSQNTHFFETLLKPEYNADDEYLIGGGLLEIILTEIDPSWASKSLFRILSIPDSSQMSFSKFLCHILP